jgi:hypothetical protein
MQVWAYPWILPTRFRFECRSAGKLAELDYRTKKRLPGFIIFQNVIVCGLSDRYVSSYSGALVSPAAFACRL